MQQSCCHIPTASDRQRGGPECSSPVVVSPQRLTASEAGQSAAEQQLLAERGATQRALDELRGEIEAAQRRTAVMSEAAHASDTVIEQLGRELEAARDNANSELTAQLRQQLLPTVSRGLVV